MQFRNSTVNVAGTVSVAGTVNVAGNVNVLPTDNPLTLFGPAALAGSPVTPVLDVRAYQCLNYWLNNTAAADGTLLFAWYADAGGTQNIGFEVISLGGTNKVTGGLCWGQMRTRGPFVQIQGGPASGFFFLEGSYRALDHDVYINNCADKTTPGTAVGFGESWVSGGIVVAANSNSGVIYVPSRHGRADISISANASAGLVRAVVLYAPGGNGIVQSQCAAADVASQPQTFYAPKQQLAIELFTPTATGGTYTVCLNFIDG